MLDRILLAIIQAATEFLPISSSGHLALASNLISKSQPDLFFFTVLHVSSLIAAIIFTRKEIGYLLSFNKQYKKMWLYLIVATIPAVLFGFFFIEKIEEAFSSLLFIGLAFIFTGIILFFTRFSKTYSKLNIKNSLIIGLFQILALFPGVSRSGITISSALFLGIDKEKATKFSFLLFIPLSLGAFILEMGGECYFSLSLVVSFFVCLILSLVFLNLLLFIAKKGKFWVFSMYCFVIGMISLFLYFLKPSFS
ncbi:undecaprenyl-diphosphate phosphatase [candidate division NPL-UPA2 bacterium]|nr:undecaprenyl-diphosphate phosphatase [candidate division NPL-UPA2 bacterium]